MKKYNKPGDKLKDIINNAISHDNIKEHFPHFKDIKSRVVRLTIWQLNGLREEMRFVYPAFCFNGDCELRAGALIEEWCREMTRYYLKIHSYQVDFGVIYQDGREVMDGIHFFKRKVPLNKIYVVTQYQQGKWMTEGEAKKFQAEKYKDYERPSLREVDEETMFEDELSFNRNFNAAVESGAMDRYPNGNRKN